MIEDYIDTASADYAAYRLLDADAPECTAAAVCSRRRCQQRLVRTSPLPLFTAACTICGIFCALHMAACPVRSRLQKLEHLLGRSGMASSFIRPAEPLAADCANREHRPWQSANGERTESFGDLFDAAVPLLFRSRERFSIGISRTSRLIRGFFPSDFNGNPVKNGK